MTALPEHDCVLPIPEDAPAALRESLALTLREIEIHDTDYGPRYQMVWAALNAATLLGYEAGVGVDPEAPEWPVVYIELPDVGQVSWHMPVHQKPWDGHTTHEKYGRIREWINAQ